MGDWIKIGTRYINLSTITEVRLHEQPRFARIYFMHGATADLDEDDTDALLMALGERVQNQAEPRRTVVTP